MDILKVPISSRENQYILVAQDYFLKMPFAQVIQDQKADMTVKIKSINQSINQYIAFLLCRRSLGYTLIYIIPIGLGTVANVTVLQFCIYNLLSLESENLEGRNLFTS